MAKPRPEKRPRPKSVAGVSEEVLAQEWEQRSRSPAAWLDSAKIVSSCARTIGGHFVEALMSSPNREVAGEPAMLFGPVFQMLAGYAIEALLKGILVARHRDAIREGRLPTWLTHHNLEDLLTRAGVTLDDHLLAFVRRVNVAVVWSGRYPVPKDRASMDAGFGTSSDLYWFGDIYHLLFVTLEIEMSRTPEGRSQ